MNRNATPRVSNANQRLCNAILPGSRGVMLSGDIFYHARGKNSTEKPSETIQIDIPPGFKAREW